MERKIIWTERASSDIEAIVRYIARRDSSAASRIGLGIYDRAQILLGNPEAGSVLDELREGGWRKRGHYTTAPETASPACLFFRHQRRGPGERIPAFCHNAFQFGFLDRFDDTGNSSRQIGTEANVGVGDYLVQTRPALL
jgi:plasmid stabilization system protein ParE